MEGRGFNPAAGGGSPLTPSPPSRGKGERGAGETVLPVGGAKVPSLRILGNAKYRDQALAGVKAIFNLDSAETCVII